MFSSIPFRSSSLISLFQVSRQTGFGVAELFGASEAGLPEKTTAPSAREEKVPSVPCWSVLRAAAVNFRCAWQVDFLQRTLAQWNQIEHRNMMPNNVKCDFSVEPFLNNNRMKRFPMNLRMDLCHRCCVAIACRSFGRGEAIHVLCFKQVIWTTSITLRFMISKWQQGPRVRKALVCASPRRVSTSVSPSCGPAGKQKLRAQSVSWKRKHFLSAFGQTRPFDHGSVVYLILIERGLAEIFTAATLHCTVMIYHYSIIIIHHLIIVHYCFFNSCSLLTVSRSEPRSQW